MADFEDDLLALAGDESDAGEEQEELMSNAPISASASPAAARSPTPEQSPPRPSTEDKPKTPTRRGGSSKAMATKSSTQRSKGQESDEEGEASSAASSPQSLGSGAMSESDSDISLNSANDRVVDDDNPYPLEGKFRDAKDRARILSLTQLEREGILADREEEQAGKKRDLQLKSLLQNKDREAEKSQKKRKAGAADLDDPERKSTKPKTTLDVYKSDRKKNLKDRERTDRVRGKRHSRSLSVSSAGSSVRDADGESESSYSGSKVRAPEPEVSAELGDIKSLKMGRDRFAQVLFYPGFEEAMVGCFVRICIGPDKDKPNGAMLYRMGEIKAITTGKPYQIDWNKMSFYTDQYAILTEGKLATERPFTHCSSSPITEDEFMHYRRVVLGDGMALPTKSECTKRIVRLNALVSRRFTGEEITAKLAKQNKYRHLLQPKISVVKQTLNNDRNEKLRLRNEMNRKQNEEDVRNALLAERRLKRQAQHEAAKKSMLGVPGNDMDGLFSEGSDISRAATPVPRVKPKQKGGMPTFSQLTTDDEIIGSMDLGIDIDIDSI